MTKPKNTKNKFEGKSFLLTSHVTFSSATMLTAAFKCYNMGIIIGEETGGLLESFGDVISIQLPNTKILAGCSHKKFVLSCSTGDIQGVKPDYEIKLNIDNRKNESDPAIEKVKELILKQNQ